MAPFCLFVKVTAAPGTTEPLASSTVPTTEPYRTWAAVGAAPSVNTSTAISRAVKALELSRMSHLLTENRVRDSHRESRLCAQNYSWAAVHCLDSGRRVKRVFESSDGKLETAPWFTLSLNPLPLP